MALNAIQSQQESWPEPRFEVISQEGPTHKPIFTVKVILKEFEATALGNNKKVQLGLGLGLGLG